MLVFMHGNYEKKHLSFHLMILLINYNVRVHQELEYKMCISLKYYMTFFNFFFSSFLLGISFFFISFQLIFHNILIYKLGTIHSYHIKILHQKMCEFVVVFWFFETALKNTFMTNYLFYSQRNLR